MKTRFLVSLLSIIPLAGTLVRSVPPPRTPSLAIPGQKIVRQDQLTAQLQQSAKLFRTGDFQSPPRSPTTRLSRCATTLASRK